MSLSVCDVMYSIVREATERKRFYDTTRRDRQNEARRRQFKNNGHPSVPAFDKHRFAKRGFVLTPEVRHALITAPENRTQQDKLALKPLIDSLTPLHNDDDASKEAIANTVTYRKCAEFDYVHVDADVLYILTGSLELTFDYSVASASKFYRPNVVYTFSQGDFIGLITDITAEGKRPKTTKPSTIYAKEASELLLLDSESLRKEIEAIRHRDGKAKLDFLKSIYQVAFSKEERHALAAIMTRIVSNLWFYFYF